MKFSKQSINYVSDVSRMSQVPTLNPGEMLIMAESNFMIDSDIVPYANFDKKTSWIVNIDKDTQGSYRSCPGGTDLMKLGVTIPLWSDLHIRPSMDGKAIDAEFNLEQERPGKYAGLIDRFMYSQTGECPFTDKREDKVKQAQYLKLVTPFMFKTPKGYSTMITGSPLNPSAEFDVIPGIVNTDYYHTCNVVLNILTDKEFTIERGTPIANLTVFKREDNIKNVYIGDESVFELHRRLGFGGVWRLGRWKRGKYKKEQRAWDTKL
jgi:dUTPase